MKNVIVSQTPKSIPGEIVQYVRKDGLTVFLNNDPDLDFIRVHGKPTEVIKAVAIRRCQQIAKNYARKYAPELLENFQIPQTSTVQLLK